MDKKIKTRIIHKHATESEWIVTNNFIPKNGELIIYDEDATYNYKRMKIGDGTHNINTLSFIDDNIKNTITSLINKIETLEKNIDDLVIKNSYNFLPLSQEEYNALTDIDDSTIYIIEV